MGYISDCYLGGQARAVESMGLCKIANLQAVVILARHQLEKIAQGESPEPTPQELQQVSQSGVTEGDIQAAAKVVQVIAEMKQQADMATGAAQAPGAMGAQPQQPPMPPPPSAPQGMPQQGMPPQGGSAQGMPPDMG